MIHRPIQVLFVFVILSWFGYASPLAKQANPNPAVSADRTQTDRHKSSLERLNQMTPEQLVELGKKKRQFDELSPPQKQQVRDFHSKLQLHANQTELSAVMKRYYAWLRNLDREERNLLLDLPPNERLKQIKKIHEERARKLFGTTGATKLPSQDVQPFIEWIKEVKKNKQSEIAEYFRSDDAKKKLLDQWIQRQRRSGRRFRKPRGDRQKPPSSEQGENVFFHLRMEADPEFMAELIFEEIDSLLAKLSQEALQIFDEQNTEEQKLLVYNWAAAWARQISSTRRTSDDELNRFYETLPEQDKKKLDHLSRREWRQRMEVKYQRELRARKPPDIPLEQNRPIDPDSRPGIENEATDASRQ